MIDLGLIPLFAAGGLVLILVYLSTRRAYQRVGFTQVATFSTVLLD